MKESDACRPESFINQRPWVLIALMPQHKPRSIGQFANRSDAEAMMRFLQRKVPIGQYSVIFDPGEDDFDRSNLNSTDYRPLPIKINGAQK